MLNIEILASLALDDSDVMCYIVDMESLELLYINELARLTFAPFSTGLTPGKKCYSFLHGKSEICDICNNHLLQKGQKLYTEIQNERNKKYYSHIDSIVEYAGRKLKVTFAYDASRHVEEIKSLTKIISVEETLIKCIQTLSEDVDFDRAIMNLLSIVCQFYDADRSYLFEINSQNNTATNIYEWCISPELATIDEVPVFYTEEISPILEAFEKDDEMVIDNVEEELDHDSALYKVLHETSCQSVHLVPLRVNGQITYFMGVDNPRRETKDLQLLHSIIIFVADDMKKNKIFKQLEHLSYTDILTGLSNRNKYLERLENMEIKKLSCFGYLHININGLKKLNELYGEQYGDGIIKQVSCILLKHVKTDIFRVAGDEFIALCPNISQEKFETIVHKLRKEEQEETDFSFAVGGIWQDKKIDLRQGLTQACDVMFSEKQNFYTAQVADRVQSRLNPVEIIINELKAKSFFVYLQPKVDLISGKITSCEALVRKMGQDNKIISPDRFIPIYENEGTIKQLDFFVLEEVCLVLQGLIKEGKALPIAVNFSRVTFIAYDIIDDIVKICSQYQVPHHFIKIELTESIDKMDFEFFHRKIRMLKDLGFEVSLDDFGAKHSNLLMLTMAEFTEVKIDKGLVDNITSSAENRTVVRNVIKTIRELGKSNCVAEGIETKEQVLLLQDFGCTYGQGYYFYRPMPISDFLTIYDENKAIDSPKETIDTYKRKNYVVNYDELYSIIEATPLCINLWDNKPEPIMCNKQTVKFFGLSSSEEYFNRFYELSPKYQPNGKNSEESVLMNFKELNETGFQKLNWMHCTLDGEEIPTEVTQVRLDVKSEDGDFLNAVFLRDLRPQLAGSDEMAWASEFFFNEVSDKTLFNTISEIAAEFFWVYNNRTRTIQFFGKGRELLDLPTEKMDFPKRILELNIPTEKYVDEFLKFSKAMEEGRYYPIELEFNLPDKTIRYFRIDYKVIFNGENNPMFCIGKTSDIHDKKQLELLQK